MANDEIQFCPYCGTKIDKGASFCKNCGKAIRFPSKSSDEEENQYNENQNKRKTVYEGVLHKCPNCGELIDSFVTVCPSCGYEIRGAQSTGTVRELAKKLEEIEEMQMPTFQEKPSIMKTLFGKDFHNTDEENEARNQFERQKIQQKANLIVNFPVPNTREDIIEFMLLASSNISSKHIAIDEVSKAWISKLDQVYQRAKLTMGNTPEFAQISYIYNSKKEEMHKRKMTILYIVLACVVGYLLFNGILLIIAAIGSMF